MKRCVIIAGAEIRDYGTARSYIHDGDHCIFCDCGLAHAQGLGVTPTLIIGDFDSDTRPQTDIETIVLPREKDDTDSFFAVREAVRRGYDSFVLLGVIGGRLDHTLANLSVLQYLHSLGKQALAADDRSEISIISGRAYIEDSFPYFSLINLDGSAHGISISGAKFPLENGEFNWDYQYAVSNEVLPGQRACVTVREGSLLLIKDR